MTHSSSRRDPRYTVPPGQGTIEFAGPRDDRCWKGTVKRLSISGICCEIVTGELELRAEEILGGCTLRVGQLAMRGEITVRSRRSLPGSISEFGGLFYPESGPDEHRLRRCIESLERGRAPGGEGRPDARGGLYLRCGSCHRAGWLESPTARKTCDCGERLELGEFADPDFREQLGDLARQLGRQHHVDLPAAHSVVAGSMSLEQAIELGHGSSPTCRLVPPDAAAPRKRIRYDPAFREAVEAGLLSPMQAFERGKRESFTRKLTERHGIPMQLAYAVADNRTSLLQAIRTRRSARAGKPVPSPADPGRERFRWSTALALVVFAIAAAGVLSGLREPPRAELETLPAVVQPGSRSETAASAVSSLRVATQVERDEVGRIVRAVGPDPRSVLLAVCEGMPGYEPIEVTSAYPPAANARLGIVRDSSNRELAVLPLRRDVSTRRWVAGDGTEPLHPAAAAGPILDRLSRR